MSSLEITNLLICFLNAVLPRLLPLNLALACHGFSSILYSCSLIAAVSQMYASDVVIYLPGRDANVRVLVMSTTQKL